MASVWSATNIFTERQFAIKFMLPAVAKTPEAARRFLMEAKVSARVDHANIIEIIDVGQTEDGSLFLVMELLSGVSLETAIRRQSPPMTVAEFLAVMVQVARALSAAHKSGVIHRDLKPTNIFLHKDREGAAVPKLLDFGVSKFLEEEGVSSLTIAGTVLGSPLYMSPEQAMGAPVDARTDVFGFGAIMFEALCGCRAYDAPNFNALIVAIATTQPKKIDEVAPQLPEKLRAIVRDCMVTDRTKRVDSFEAIAERIMTILPEIERSELKLPSPRHSGESLSDPDATNALPVVRGSGVPSDRPAQLGAATSPGAVGPRSGNGPASGYSAPWATPAGSSQVGQAPGTNLAPAALAGKPRFAYVAGGVAFGVVAAVIAVGMIRGAKGEPHAVQGGEAVAAAPAIELPATPAATASVPVISIDSLPVAPSNAPQAQVPSPARGTGRLFISAAPSWCSISVDGMKRGPTPLPAIDLSAGPHTLRCEAPSGHSKSASIIVSEGATSRYKFTVD
jgi:serine/threonine-protein kinase